MRIKIATYIVRSRLGSYAIKVATLKGAKRRELVRVNPRSKK